MEANIDLIGIDRDSSLIQIGQLKGRNKKNCNDTVGKSQINIKSKTWSKTSSD